MAGYRAIAMLILGGLFLPAVFAGPRARGIIPVQKKLGPKSQVQRQPGRAGNNVGINERMGGRPGAQLLQRLAAMTPEEREKALANLPPERRENMIRRLENFRSMPPEARERATTELERLSSLPPQRQNQVRRALRQLQALPDDRKAIVGAELERLSAMPEEERRVRMNTEEFRNRYSPAEQQMLGNLSEVLPRE
jgi:phage-related protein